MKATKFIIFFVILLLIFPFNFMDTWGTTPKSQTDNELVEAAVNRLIAAHNDDPDAHIGTGRSLSVHRESDVIDHKAGSIPLDKKALDQVFVSTVFDSLDAFLQSGSVALFFPGVQLYTERFTEPFSYLWAALDPLVNWSFLDKESLIQFVLIIDQGSSAYDAFFGLYDAASTVALPVTVPHFGFYINGGTLKASVRAGSTTTTVTITGITLTTRHVYRAHYFPPDNTVYFYIDGNLVASVAVPSGSRAVGSPGFLFASKMTGSGGTGAENLTTFGSLDMAFNIN